MVSVPIVPGMVREDTIASVHSGVLELHVERTIVEI